MIWTFCLLMGKVMRPNINFDIPSNQEKDCLSGLKIQLKRLNHGLVRSTEIQKPTRLHDQFLTSLGAASPALNVGYMMRQQLGLWGIGSEAGVPQNLVLFCWDFVDDKIQKWCVSWAQSTLLPWTVLKMSWRGSCKEKWLMFWLSSQCSEACRRDKRGSWSRNNSIPVYLLPTILCLFVINMLSPRLCLWLSTSSGQVPSERNVSERTEVAKRCLDIYKTSRSQEQNGMEFIKELINVVLVEHEWCSKAYSCWWQLKLCLLLHVQGGRRVFESTLRSAASPGGICRIKTNGLGRCWEFHRQSSFADLCSAYYLLKPDKGLISWPVRGVPREHHKKDRW